MSEELQPPAAAGQSTGKKRGEAAAQVDEGAKRIAEIRARRSERGPPDLGMSMRLSIPAEAKDPRFEYRWATDTGNRIHDLKAKDWDVAPGETVEGDARNMGVGTVPERMANARTVIKPERHVLMRKPKEFYQEDKDRELAKIKADEAALRVGDVKSPQGLSGPGTYIPAGGMKIEQGR